MKEKRQNRSIFFRGMVLVVALALMVIYLPFNGLVALAQMAKYTDYSLMTIGRTGEEFSTTVAKGKEYIIPNAYIGGDENFKVGKISSGSLGKTDDLQEVTLKASTVTVSYSGLVMDEYTDKVTDETDITDKVVVTTDAGNYGYFVADKVGTYTITYSYSYEIGDDTYTNSYELKVTSEITNASINFDSNSANIMPTNLDLAQAAVGDSYKDLYLPIPEIKDEDGETVEDVTYGTSKDEIASEGNFVLVTAKGGISTSKITLSGEGENLYIAGSVFADENYGAGKYVVTYAYYADGQFITSTTKSTQVWKEYYTGGYNLKLELTSDWVNSAQTGVESTLPTATGVTTGDTKPADEAVDVYYTVKVYYKKTNSSEGYKLLSSEEIARYNEDAGETVINSDGTLVDATKFKPLDDGSYSFVYDIYDYYYVEGSADADKHHKSTSIGSYDWENIKDETAPTPIVYDASETDEEGNLTYNNVSTNLKSRASANSVVIYAIGIKDNVSKNGDEGIELTRKIMTDETVTKLTIADYDNYNLIFNYRKDSKNSEEAYSNLLYNNFLINKAVVKSGANINSDADMLAWLVDNNYRIVVDNNNAEHIASLFGDFVTAEQATKLTELNTAYENASTSDKAAALKARNNYVKEVFGTQNAFDYGFAYIDVDQTFGAITTDGGMGVGTYYIHYVAKDAAGNEKDFSQAMYITSSLVDNEIPEIKFPTTLADSYLPTATVTFDVPTVSDNSDNYMQERVMYRYLDTDKNVIIVKDGEETLSKVDLTELWADLGTETAADGKLLTDKYSAYHSEIADTYTTDGYIEITDADASSYSIKLKEGTDKATYLQIVTFVYDDAGNANIYGETINILNVVDNIAPIFKTLDTNDEFVKEYEQGAEIELPSFTVMDDAVDFMDYEINVYYVKGATKTKISTYDFSTSRKVLNSKGEGYYTVNAGKFIAPFAGQYQVSIAIKDYKNNTIVSFINYNVSERNIVQPPVISTSLESKTIELGETVDLPTPSVNYDIPNSMVYDEFVANGADAKTKFIVRGVDANGKATNYSTTYGQKGSFKPNAIGEYPIIYFVDLEVYNHNMFEYVEMNLSENIEGGYYKLVENNEDVQINKVGDIFVVTTDDGVFDVVKDEQGVHVYNHETNVSASVDDGILSNKETLKEWFENLNVYHLESDTYTIIAQDTKGPVLNGGNRYDYETVLDTDVKTLTIYGIEASDISELDEDNSKITVSAKLANSNPGDQEYKGAKAFVNNELTLYNDNGKVLDGVYTITYKVYDKKGNVTTDTYTISVGDTEEPTLTFDEDFVEESYEIGSKLRIDITKIHWDDHGREFPEGTTPTIKLINTSTNKEVAYEIVGDYYEFEEFTTVGTYKLTVEVEDAVGHKSTHSGFSIEVTEKSVDAVMTYKVVGIILIVISVLVLVGVIVYFIVSKVKLDKELKK